MLEIVAECGGTDAYLTLAKARMNEDSPLGRDGKAVLTYAQKGFDAGNVQCLALISEVYFGGFEVDRDYEIAFQYAHRLVSEFGVMMQLLPIMYAKGMGTPASPETAARLYKDSAHLDPEFKYGYARCLEHGIGVEIDMKMAVQYYEEAASEGSSRARGRLHDLGVDAGDVATAA